MRRLCLLMALLSLAGVSLSAPLISRVTPPSRIDAKDAGAPSTARFLPGQRFDLQATVQPDEGQTLQEIRFIIDDTVIETLHPNERKPKTQWVTEGLVSTLKPHSVVASYRAFSLDKPGRHTLKIQATDTHGDTTVSEAHIFEIVELKSGQHPIKNVLIFLGDGMGAAHRTAARIVTRAYDQGKPARPLAMDTLPTTGLVMTSSLNSIVTDSSPGMSNYVTGNKAANNEEGVFPDDTIDPFDNPRVEYLSEYFHRTRGTALGLVTTADVADATPAANAVHTSDRTKGSGIVDQYLDDADKTGLKVLMGGGRKWFLPNPEDQHDKTHPVMNGSQRTRASDYVLPIDLVEGWQVSPGKKDPERNLIDDFIQSGWAYAHDRGALNEAVDKKPKTLLGLFSYSNMNVAFDKIQGRRCEANPSSTAFCEAGHGHPVVDDFGFPGQPMLDEMTDAALKVLDQYRLPGFILMVEGASIDKQSHLMDADRWIHEVIEFDHAVEVGLRYTRQHPDTLIIITADHECSGAAIIGTLKTAPDTLKAGGVVTEAVRDKSVGVYESAGFPRYRMLADGYPETPDIKGKVLIGYGANATRSEAYLAKPRPTLDPQQPFAGIEPLNSYPATPAKQNEAEGLKIVGQVPGELAVHTATDVPLSAEGPGALLFTGYMDNTDVFFKLGQLLIRGEALK